MPGEIGDDEHLVAQRRHEQQVYIREQSRHLERYLAPEPIGLDEVDRRQESRFAKQVGPGVGNLNFELARLPTEREFLERGGGLGEENELQRIVRPVRKRY